MSATALPASATGNDLWFSQKDKTFGGNVQFLSAPDGTPLWVSDVEPGSTPDITAARNHVLPALYKAAAGGLPALADKGYIGAAIGIRVPHGRPKGQSERALHADNRMFNALVRHVRALGERAAAELKQRWRSLQHGTLSPSRIGERSPSRTRPQRNMGVSAVGKTSVSAKVNTGHIRRVRCLLPRQSAPCRTPGPPR
ncbi:transposase family protein [Streptomyces sp. NBC_01643]|uniref:transposase family protein n=1 Tax=Streptomyces sp. NBC_01643 TaxID=2975906 RepID=UPI003863616A|nr:transposase family protein [Streptomyces sp. NBC_01643]